RGGHVTGVQTCALPIFSDEPRGDELRVGANRCMGPDVAVAVLALVLIGDVLLLRVAVRPNLIDLKHGAGKAPQYPVLMVGASVRSEERRVGKECRSRWE